MDSNARHPSTDVVVVIPPSAVGGAGDRFFGYPDQALAGTWTVKEVCAFLRVSERKARELMKAPDAPSPLRTGSDRCDRWNPYQVVAWLHGAHDPATPAATADGSASAPSPARTAPGRPWAPAAGR